VRSVVVFAVLLISIVVLPTAARSLATPACNPTACSARTGESRRQRADRNGLWSGFAMPEAIAEALRDKPAERVPRQVLVSDHERIRRCVPQTRVLVPASSWNRRTPHAPETLPEMENGSCVGADGQRAFWDPARTKLLHVRQQSIYREVLYKQPSRHRCRRDLVLIDESGKRGLFY